MFTKLRTRLLNGLTSRNVPTNKWHFRPTVESLEDRTLLATRFLLTGYPALATAGVMLLFCLGILERDLLRF